MKQPSLSVIIPTLNGEKTLPDFFAALKMQSLEVDEILVGDSESSDRTAEICRAHGAKVISIARDDFDHGGTRTMLGEYSKGDILIYFTQDAVLSTPHSLKNLVQPLMDDTTLCCGYGRQLPAPDASLLAAHLRRFNYPADSGVRSYADRGRLGLKTIFISNSFAAYKRGPLAAVGYFKNGLIFGEDTCTLGKLLREGGCAYYAGDASVYHSHNYTYIQEFKRSFDIGVLHTAENWILHTYGEAEGVGRNYVRSALGEIISQKKYTIVFDWFFRSGVKFIGYKLGRMYVHLPKALNSRCSLNRAWWQKNGN